jgi:hypothetical protein
MLQVFEFEPRVNPDATATNYLFQDFVDNPALASTFSNAARPQQQKDSIGGRSEPLFLKPMYNDFHPIPLIGEVVKFLRQFLFEDKMLMISGIVVAAFVGTKPSKERHMIHPNTAQDRIVLSQMNNTLLSRIDNEICKMESHIQLMNDAACQIEFELLRTNNNSTFLTLKLQSINEGIKTAESILQKNYTWKQSVLGLGK